MKNLHIRLYFQYILTHIFLGSISVLPFKMRIRVGGAILGFLIANLGKTKGRIEANLTKIFPDMPATDKGILRKKIGKTFGRTYTEILNAKTYAKHQDLLHASGEGLKVIENRAAKGQGFILVSGHFGQWDAARHFLKAKGIEVGAIYRASNNHYFDRIFVPQIKAAGEPVFVRGRGTIGMVRHIKNNGPVAILIDQKFNRGVSLDFLGQPAMTSTSAADMALRYNVPMIPVYGIRRDKSLDIDIVFEAPIAPSDALTMTKAATDSLAARVHTNPEQWYWLHQRWKPREMG